MPVSVTLRDAALKRRTASLFKAMSTDFLLREQFLTGPAQVLSDFIVGHKLPDEEAEGLNRLIYSIAANRPLLAWIRQYALLHEEDRPSLEQFLSDFSHAVAERRAGHVISSLVSHSMHSSARLSPEAMTSVSNGLIHIFGSGPDRPGGGIGNVNDPGETFPIDTFQTQGTWTENTGPGTWTTMDTETGTIFTAGGTAGTEITVTDLETWHTVTDSTGTDTTGTDSTGTDMTGTSETGTDTTGTDSVTYEGTDDQTDEQTGTETGTDGEFSFSRYNWAAITLNALAQYASQLARQGALGATPVRVSPQRPR